MTEQHNIPESMIVELQILDAYGRVVKGRYKLRHGQNKFSCMAVYSDGSEREFSAYWTCPMILARGGEDFTGALGTDRMTTVIINAAPNHIKYAELACWVKFPDGPNTNANQYPHIGIGFDYSEITSE